MKLSPFCELEMKTQGFTKNFEVKKVVENEEEKQEEKAEEKKEEPADPGTDYILNTNTKKFHYPTCASVKKMKDKNKKEFHGTRDEVIAKGYDPCGNCHP